MSDYYDLGNHSRAVSTESPQAQIWFDRGLVWCYGFNHEEAVRCFEKVAASDPGCAMAHWGIAYAAGPNYNLTWEDLGIKTSQKVAARCYGAIQEALVRLPGATEVEQALVKALAHRYPAAHAADLDELSAWNDAYAAAMRKVQRAYVNDLDVTCLCAEALITRTPWQLWDVTTGLPADGADTLEAVALLEQAFEQIERSERDPHPGLLHMYIHSMEMSPHPERALPAANKLRYLVPEAGHLLHMPSHIDILCGNYQDAVEANSRAIVADNKYLARQGAQNIYTAYRCHDFHFKIYAAMFLGRFEAALEAANQMAVSISEEVLRIEAPNMADLLESLVSMKMHVLIRFGRWQDIINEPLPGDSELYCHTTAMIHYAKGVAHAASGDVEAAELAKAEFEAARLSVPESRNLFNNSCEDVLAIAAQMLDGELAYRRGDHERAFAHLRKSVELDDNLAYAEPWGWMQPTRHALGALLLEQDRIGEAEAVYRADLGLDDTLSRPSQHPDNVWSLHGYVECLRRLDKEAETLTYQARLDRALEQTDVPIHASCYCRLEEHGCCDSEDC